MQIDEGVCARMKRLLLLLSILLIILTFAGAVFVLASNGAANAGYAVIPMVLAWQDTRYIQTKGKPVPIS